MIDDVLDAFVRSHGEREFDAPFLLLLRALGFYDIHFLHGPFEFRKDFIAKRHEDEAMVQYAFQTKGGNIDVRTWRELRGQIDQMRTNVLAHSNFDKSLPKRIVAVCTGTLVGAAPIEAQQYRDHLAELGEASYETWTASTVVEFMRDHPHAGLAGHLSGPLLGLIGDIYKAAASDRDIEQFSRRWYQDASDPIALYRAALEASLIANLLADHNRLDLAAYTDLCLLRAGLVAEHLADEHRDPAPGELVSSCGRAQFSIHAAEFFTQVQAMPTNVEEWIDREGSFAAWVTYPTRCSKVMEIVGLHALLNDDTSAVEWVVDFVGRQPGTAHPISDRWAVSIIPAFICSQRSRPDTVRPWLTELIRWVADRYEQASGLASADATLEREVDMLLGSALEHVDFPPRTASMMATLVLDVTTVIDDEDLYQLASNEFQAVGIYPVLDTVEDTADQYKLEGVVYHHANIGYGEDLGDHLGVRNRIDRSRTRRLMAYGRWWDLLAVSSVTRSATSFRPSAPEYQIRGSPLAPTTGEGAPLQPRIGPEGATTAPPGATLSTM